MKKSFLFSVFLSGLLGLSGLIAASMPVQAQTSRLYISGYMGLNLPREGAFDDGRTGQSGDIEMSNGMALAGALGVRIDQKWRVEAEASLRTVEMSQIDFASGASGSASGELTSWLFMLNGYYDFDTEWQGFQPFATAGIGIVHHTGEIDDRSIFNADVSDNSMGYALQFGGGAKYRVNPDMAITTGYRYLMTSDIKWEDYDLAYSSHEIRVGLEYDIPVRR